MKAKYSRHPRPGFQIGLIIFTFAIFTALGCNKNGGDQSHFELLEPEVSGISFQNQLTPTLDFNVFNYMYFYNGGGTAAGDFNNDGLIDLYFTANQERNALYLNKGGLVFEDVTQESGTAGKGGWTTGVTLVDINNDSLLDIYVSQVGDYRNIKGKNELFVCTGVTEQGIPVYEDRAADYGLDLIGFGTQACFFDFDLDGDLDFFQMNHSLHQNGTFGQRKVYLDSIHPLAGDRLLRNDEGSYVDVTIDAGLQSSAIGYGLGVAISDINKDGYPDLYVANDFHENDYLYVNQQDGTFRECIEEYLRHTSRFSMGVDIADINNDGHNEIITLDMHPEDPHILKASLGEDGYNIFQFKLGYGYNHQYARNNLQLNNANGTFSEIGIYAGVHASDWSWAPLFFDFDNDGLRDLFISNGIPKRMNDIDYVNFVSNDEIQYRISYDQMEAADLALIDKLPEIKLLNKFYRNTGNLAFDDLSERIINPKVSFSNGAVYADFDNDGDLDIAVNNIRDNAFIYRNNSDGDNHYIALELAGPARNVRAIGSRVIVKSESGTQIYENFPVRGYQAHVSERLHIGLGDDSPDREIHLIWPDGTWQDISGLAIDTLHRVSWRAGLPDYSLEPVERSFPMTEDITKETGIYFVHDENPFIEFNRERLIPHMTSAEGPALSVGDVNGDGLEDVVFGGAKHQSAQLYIQGQEGQFSLAAQPAFEEDSLYEDVDAAFIDVEKDGDLDLVIVSGGNEFPTTSPVLWPRLYINNGEGFFVREYDAFDTTAYTLSCVLPSDFNGDGYVDLFMGGRAVPWSYGVRPESYFMLNNGDGSFTDVTAAIGDNLSFLGFVKGGEWTDIENDGDYDLVLAMEWGPVTILRNEGGKFVKDAIRNTDGWWNFVMATDYDNDGDVDIIAGGPGQNTKLKPAPDRPVYMFANDFDGNGQIEQVLTYYLDDQVVLLPTYAEVTSQIPDIKKEYLYAQDFAAASVRDIFGAEKITNAITHKATMFESSIFENQGDGSTFIPRTLPRRLQFAPQMTCVEADVNNDGLPDYIMGGNFYEANIELGRYDADYGTVLLNGKNGPGEEGVHMLGITGQIRKIAPITIDGREAFILARNDDSAVVIRLLDQRQIEL